MIAALSAVELEDLDGFDLAEIAWAEHRQAQDDLARALALHTYAMKAMRVRGKRLRALIAEMASLIDASIAARFELLKAIDIVEATTRLVAQRQDALDATKDGAQ